MYTAFPPDPEPAAAPASRQRLRLLAVTAWIGFVGAALTLLLFVVLVPHDARFDLGDLSVFFLCAWVLSMVTIGLALMLALPGGAGPNHGR